VFVANDTNTAEWYLKNNTAANDTFAPVMYRLTQVADRAAGAAPTIVRVQVYDNAPYYITWYNNTRLEYQVNGGAVQTVTMQSSGGQIFRALIPGNVVGNVTYRVLSTDKYGNTGTTGTLTNNFFTVPAGVVAGPFEVKCTSIFIKGSDTSVAFSVAAGLTNVKDSDFPAITGSNGFTGVG
jgi:hypothetical protein